MITETSESKLERLDTALLPDRVKAELLRMITSGGFVGGRIPREEVLALELGVSRGTARAALRSLEEQGLVIRQRGRGTFVNQHAVGVTGRGGHAGFSHACATRCR